MMIMSPLRVFLLAGLILIVFGIDSVKAEDEWDYESPQVKLCCNEWTGDWDDNNDGSYTWYENDDSSLKSDTFTVWNSKPVLVVRAEYNLDYDSSVKAQVKTGNSGAWYDIKWRSIDRVSTLYSIPGEEYDDHPENWNGFSDEKTFFADLGLVEEIGDADGNLQEQYIGQNMQIRFVASVGSGSGGSFTVTPSVVGVDEHAVAVKEVSPTSQNGEPSSITGEMVAKTYTVKSNNFGAVSDSIVIDFFIKAADNSFITLDDGTFAIIDSIIQKKSTTYVGVAPIGGSWGGDRDDPNGGSPIAYIDENGIIMWPSGTTEQFSRTGWKIDNPTKSSWDDVNGKPNEPDEVNFASPGTMSTVSIHVTTGFAKWALPGTYVIQVDARSWLDYDHTFTSNDPYGQATLVIPQPDLSIGYYYSYTDHAIGHSPTGQGWVKNTCMKTDGPYYSFMFEVVNSGTQTVGTFKLGFVDDQGNPLGVHVGIYWSDNSWAIDESETTAEGAEIVVEGNTQYVVFKATSEDLGMSEGPGEDTNKAYDFRVVVDVGDEISESNENNNRLAIEMWAVSSSTTTGGVNGIIGYDISLMYGEMPKSRSSIGNVTPRGSTISFVDGSGDWTVQVVMMQPHLSVSSVYWYLLNQNNDIIDHGLVFDIYGCSGFLNNSVTFEDYDYSGTLSSGDKFRIYPGTPSSVLESISSVEDYKFRLRYIGNNTNDTGLDPIIEPVTDEDNKDETKEDNKDETKDDNKEANETDTENLDSGPLVESLEEEQEIPSLGLVTSLILVGLIAIFRRK